MTFKGIFIAVVVFIVIDAAISSALGLHSKPAQCVTDYKNTYLPESGPDPMSQAEYCHNAELPPGE